MIDKAYMEKMALYNRWQNENLYGAADSLSDAARKQDRGAFFGSIHGTLSHLVWGDRMWLSRFGADVEKPAVGIQGSAGLYAGWEELKRERTALDRKIVDWISGLDAGWIEGDFRWFSGAMQREITLPKWICIVHLFNHQTHHRGQVHGMLTQAGAKPGDTDLPFMR